MDFVITTRRVKGDAFDDKAEPGPARFLRVPTNAKAFTPAHAISGAGSLKTWVDEVIGLADGDENPNSISPTGDILVFVHGYNNDPTTVLWRLRRLTKDMRAEGWRGQIIAFDWPSENQVLNYLEDRSDGAAVAVELVHKCVEIVARGQEQGCTTNIHLLGHSTGAYVIMEAFAQAQKDGKLFRSDWKIGQTAFIAADVSSSSLADASQAPMFDRIDRLTNYSNPFDAVLGVSNAKRLGTSPRAGRSGLPRTGQPAPAQTKTINVNCGAHFNTLNPDKLRNEDGFRGNFTHSWHIGDRTFARDLAMSLEGAISREAIPTRELTDGEFHLVNRQRPKFMDAWKIKEDLGPRPPL